MSLPPRSPLAALSPKRTHGSRYLLTLPQNTNTNTDTDTDTHTHLIALCDRELTLFIVTYPCNDSTDSTDSSFFYLHPSPPL